MRPLGTRMTRGVSAIASIALALATTVARAQSPAPPGSASPPALPPPQPPKEEPRDSGGAVPRGAAGAGIVPPKDEGAPAPAPVTITPPKLLKDEGAVYPAEAIKAQIRERVSVVVILEIDTTGAVRKATVETPVGNGFDEAAVRAAEKLQFEPAKRGDMPVASRIRHRYDFSPPAARFRGTVRSAGSDRLVTNGRVSLTAPDGVERSVDVAPDGTFVVEGLAPGNYRFRVTAEGFTPQDGTQELGPGEEITNVLRLDRAAAAEVAKTPVPEEEDVQEVRVRGVRPPREVTKRSLEQRELNRIPGTSGDALRSLQYLPGVARPPGLAGLLIVRGSAPNDTNVFVDGTLVPLIYHFGGLSSAIPTELLEKIDFYPGNFSAQYGRVMGGVVDVGMRDPKKDKKFHGLAQVDLIDARGLVEGPIFDTGWNFAVAGRRSYFDVWLKPVLEAAGAGVSTAPVYYDYQAMVARDLGKDSSLRFAFFGSDDVLRVLVKSPAASEPAIGGGLSAHTGFYRFQGRYKTKFGKDTDFRLMGAVGSDFVEFKLGENFFTLDTTPITSRVEVSQKVASGITANVGMDMLYSPYEVAVRFPPIPVPGEPPAGPFLSRPPLLSRDKDAIYRPALYTEFELVPQSGTRLVPGVRVDYAKDTRSWDVSPRFAARQDITRSPRTTLKGGVGVFMQPPQPQETNIVFGNPRIDSNRAIHYSLGAEREFTRNIELGVEAFYKQLDRLVVPGKGNDGRGKVYGLETLLRYKPDARFFGWLAYTLSRSERQDSATDPVFLSPFDQTHILTVLGSYRLGRGWEFGSAFRLVSGRLVTPQTYGFYDENAGVLLPQNAYPPFGQRLPLYHQLNVRVDKTWRFKAWMLGFYVDVQNVYNHGNVEGISQNYNFTRTTYATGIPFLPSIGLRGEF